MQRDIGRLDSQIMTNEQAEVFDWGSLGEQYWRELGTQCKATELQIRFACARHRGADATASARLAGYRARGDALRQSAHKASHSTAVMSMLALVGAEDTATPDKVLDRSSRMQMLSDIARTNPDSTAKMRAVEALNKMDEQATKLGEAADNDGLSEDRLVRELLEMKGGGTACLALWTNLDGYCPSHLPLLHDVYAAVVRENNLEFWQRAVGRFSSMERVRLQRALDDPKYQLENRIKLWAEVGVEIETPDNPAGNTTNPQAVKLNGGNGAAAGR
jgi:hypothetical protein